MRGLRLSACLLALLLAAAWAARRHGRLAFDLHLFALGAGALLALLLALTAGYAVWLARRRPARIRHASAALVSTGLALAVGAGLANWLFSLQGYVVLFEGAAVPLGSTAHLQALEAGPLARLQELDVTLRLDELELQPAGEGRFRPLSRLRVQAGDGSTLALEVAPHASAAWGRLRFHQGAFGFAPRLVILHGDRTLFDRSVPFTTTPRGPDALSFEGRFSVAAEQLEVAGQVDLAGLDEALRGHVRLGLELRRAGRMLGRGVLAPGHFADVAEDYRIGFAGLTRWSEIDVSRRHYGALVQAGAGLALLAALAWALAAWRGW